MSNQEAIVGEPPRKRSKG
jgi:hypothetical protein